MAKKQSRKRARQTRESYQQSIKELQQERRNLNFEIRQLSKDISGLDKEAQDKTDRNAELVQWNQADLRVSLIASGEPGFISATCQLNGAHGPLAATRNFHIAHICQSLPYVAPATMQAWREILTIACDMLDKSIAVHHNQCS